MVQRHYLRCAVCGTVTLVRWQVGWLERHPIRVPCGGCGVIIRGVAKTDQEKVRAEIEFENGESIEPDGAEPRFYIEASGEFVTSKLRPFGPGDQQFGPGPFMKAFASMGERYMEFNGRTLGFLGLVKNDWPKLRVILELWENGQRALLKAEIEKHAHLSDLPASEGFNLLRSVRGALVSFLLPVTDEARYRGVAKFLAGEIGPMLETPFGEAMAKHAIRTGLLRRTEAKIAGSVAAFIEKFPHLIPIFSLAFMRNKPADLWANAGVTTSSFEDLKGLYIDCYEAVADALTLVVMLNNVKLRRRFRAMAAKRRDVVTLEDFEGKAKGIRVGFVDGVEPFDVLARGGVNTKLRNAIGHRSYAFDPASQVITYHPDGSSTGAALEMPPGEFLEETWRLFETLVLDLGEAVYQVREYEFAAEGS